MSLSNRQFEAAHLHAEREYAHALALDLEQRQREEEERRSSWDRFVPELEDLAYHCGMCGCPLSEPERLACQPCRDQERCEDA